VNKSFGIGSCCRLPVFCCRVSGDLIIYYSIVRNPVVRAVDAFHQLIP
jgi:hypothetical protein